MRSLLLLIPLLLIACGDGPVGLVDVENGVRAEVTSRGIVVDNERDEPIWVEVYGEDALIFVDPRPQTVDDPGRRIGEGDRLTVSFDDGRVRRSDGYYRVYWITVKGEGSDRHIGPRGQLELGR